MKPSKWDIPLLNQPTQKPMFCMALWNQEIERMWKKELQWQRLQRVWALRRSVNER